MPQQFSELFHAQAPLRELGLSTVVAFGNGQRITGKNRGGKSRKVEESQRKCYFAFLNTQFGEGLCFLCNMLVFGEGKMEKLFGENELF